MYCQLVKGTENNLGLQLSPETWEGAYVNLSYVASCDWVLKWRPASGECVLYLQSLIPAADRHIKTELNWAEFLDNLLILKDRLYSEGYWEPGGGAPG